MERTDISRLCEHIFFVAGENRGRFPACHGLLLKGNETVLIDAGVGEARIAEIDRTDRIDVLIVTHSHPDHIRHWYLLEDRLIVMPRETPDSVADLDRLGQRFMGSADAGKEWARYVRTFGVRGVRKPDRRYSDGEVLELGGCRLEAIRAPGHLTDHYCFFDRATRTLLTTDIDLTSFGPWYGNPEADIETFRDDVKRVMSLPYERVCSSHRMPITGDASEYFQKFLESFSRQSRAVLDLCDPPASLEDIVAASPIYGNGLADKFLQKAFETTMVKKNIEILLRDGSLEEQRGRYVRT